MLTYYDYVDARDALKVSSADGLCLVIAEEKLLPRDALLLARYMQQT